jgi:hypothetical protein
VFDSQDVAARTQFDFMPVREISRVNLAGCSSLAVVALVGCLPPDSATVDGWFNDLYAAEPHSPAGSQHLNGCNATKWFYYPKSPPTTQSSDAARSALQQWWTLWHPD